MKNKNTNFIINSLNKLNQKDTEELVEKIMSMLAKNKDISLSYSCNDMVNESNGKRPDCPHCHAESHLGFIEKRGFKKSVQRYHCKKCGKYFVATTNTVFEKTRKDAETWRKFIRLTITGATLQTCADECKICCKTAFYWRHKILNSFCVSQENIFMTGTVEMDETFIAINRKGNHIQGNFNEKRTLESGLENKMPRAGYKRGSDNKSKNHNERICVVCMVENGKKSFYAAAACAGYMSTKHMDASIGKHVDSKAFMIIDSAHRNMKYLDDKGYIYLPLLSNTSDNPKEHKAEIQGPYHLQHVNAMHSHLKAFLAPYKGVSSKYLQNYLSLYVWLRSMTVKRISTIRELSLKRASFNDCYIPSKDFKNYPAIPSIA